MNSISVSNISNQPYQALSPMVRSNEDCSALAAADSVELGCSPAQTETNGLKHTGEEQASAPEPQKIKLKDLPQRIAKSKKPDKELVQYAAQHPALATAVGLGVVATCGVVGTVLVSGTGNTIKEVLALVKQAATMKSVKQKAEVFKQAGKLLGAGAAAGVTVGATGAAGIAVYKGIEGIAGVSKGLKKHDKLKTSRGARKINAGVKGALAAGTIASLGLANTRGPVGTVRAGLMPALKVSTSVLNTTVGALQLAKGIKEKNKKDILGGALNLGVGVAAGVSMAMGGGIVATACTVFSTARTVFNGVNTAVRLHKYAEEARQDLEPDAPAQGNKPQEVAQNDKAPTTKVKDGQPNQGVARDETEALSTTEAVNTTSIRN